MNMVQMQDRPNYQYKSSWVFFSWYLFYYCSSRNSTVNTFLLSGPLNYCHISVLIQSMNTVCFLDFYLKLHSKQQPKQKFKISNIPGTIPTLQVSVYLEIWLFQQKQLHQMHSSSHFHQCRMKDSLQKELQFFLPLLKKIKVQCS